MIIVTIITKKDDFNGCDDNSYEEEMKNKIKKIQ